MVYRRPRGHRVAPPAKVCQCEAVGRNAVEASIAAGATTVEQVTEACRAGGGCGRCWSSIERLLGSGPAVTSGASTSPA